MWLSLPSALLPSAPATEALSSGLMPLSHITDANTVLPLTWSGKPMRLRSLRTAWKRATWLTRLSGLTSAPSTLDAGAERWIASLRASPASRIPSPEAEKALMTRAGFGPTSPGSCVIAVRGSSCWKTSQGSLLPVDSDQSSVTWPKWGSMRNGVVSRQQPWAPRISESGGGAWRTPTACSENSLRGSGQSAALRARQGHTVNLQDQVKIWWPTPDANSSTYSNGVYGQNLREAASQWPTPRAEDSENCWNHPGATDSLTGASRLWATPDVPKGGRALTEQDVLNRGMTAKGKRQVGLENEARLWATPTNAMTTGAGVQGRQGGENLQTMAAQWATPSARGWKSGDASEATMERNARPLNEQACRFSPPAQTIHDGLTCWCGSPGCVLPAHKRKLNPLFTTILMGWPRWWLIPAPMRFARQEMEQWLSRARRRLESF